MLKPQQRPQLLEAATNAEASTTAAIAGTECWILQTNAEGLKAAAIAGTECWMLQRTLGSAHECCRLNNGRDCWTLQINGSPRMAQTVQLAASSFVLRPMCCAFSALWHRRAVRHGPLASVQPLGATSPAFPSGFCAPATARDGSGGIA